MYATFVCFNFKVKCMRVLFQKTKKIFQENGEFGHFLNKSEYGLSNLGPTSKVKFEENFSTFKCKLKFISACIICYTPWPKSTYMNIDTIVEEIFLNSNQFFKYEIKYVLVFIIFFKFYNILYIFREF